MLSSLSLKFYQCFFVKIQILDTIVVICIIFTFFLSKELNCNEQIKSQTDEAQARTLCK